METQDQSWFLFQNSNFRTGRTFNKISILTENRNLCWDVCKVADKNTNLLLQHLKKIKGNELAAVQNLTQDMKMWSIYILRHYVQQQPFADGSSWGKLGKNFIPYKFWFVMKCFFFFFCDYVIRPLNTIHSLKLHNYFPF